MHEGGQGGYCFPSLPCCLPLPRSAPNPCLHHTLALHLNAPSGNQAREIWRQQVPRGLAQLHRAWRCCLLQACGSVHGITEDGPLWDTQAYEPTHARTCMDTDADPGGLIVGHGHRKSGMKHFNGQREHATCTRCMVMGSVHGAESFFIGRQNARRKENCIPNCIHLLDLILLNQLVKGAEQVVEEDDHLHSRNVLAEFCETNYIQEKNGDAIMAAGQACNLLCSQGPVYAESFDDMTGEYL
mmetsp:Transcript_12038/g.31680  ORF Transcript_12038/g.31680 Transcript_12038/m.31680 type:complete len:242 (-) Transcript_12038:277-1002(-)